VPRNHACLVTTDPQTDAVVVEIRKLDDRPAAPPVPVPTSSEPKSPVIRSLTVASRKLRLPPELRERAKVLVQALVDEAERRGWRPEPTETTDVVQFAIGSTYRASFALDEDVPRPPGRLVLSLTEGDIWRQDRYWADRSDGRLESKLALVFRDVEFMAEISNERAAEVRRLEERITRLWNQRRQIAREECRKAMIDSTLDQELADFARAEAIRGYANSLPATRQDHGDWTAIIRARANDLDPTRRERLGVDESALTEKAIAEYLPKGMRGTHPPTLEEWFDIVLYGEPIRRTRS
jgi:hypothetical protein